MAQYPIPQFIESEGKIIFFLTFRQFFILVGGGTACILLYFILPLFLFLVFAIPIVIVTLVVAFLKVNNESVVKAFLHYVGFSTKPKNYTWKKKDLSYPFEAGNT